MRPARMLLGATLVLALAWPLRAGEVVILEGRVQTDGAEVRCKASTADTVYVTQKLPRGETVQVVKKLDGGWLEIVPPKGSYSWVNTRNLSRATADPRIWALTAEAVPVLVGSEFKRGKPNVVGATPARGTQVVAMGQPWNSEDGDGLWLPIMPPPREYRYIREKDVADLRAPPPAGTTTVAHPGSPFAAPTAGARPAGGASQALPPVSNDVHVGGTAAAPDLDALRQQAEQLERSGDRLGAARLYDQLGNNLQSSKPEAAMQYHSRAGWLRQDQPAAPRSLGDAGALYQRAQQYEKAGNVAEAIRAYQQLVELFRYSDPPRARQYYDRAEWLRAWLRRRQPAAPHSGVVQAGGVVSGLSAQTGRLMQSRTLIDRQATYVVVSPQGQVLAYLLPQAGVDLERYLNQNVEVFGHVVPNAEVRAPVLTVTRVQVLSAQ